MGRLRTYEDDGVVTRRVRKDPVCALYSVHHRVDLDRDLAEELEYHHLIDLVVLDQQDALALVAQSLRQVLEHLLLRRSHLLRAVLVAIGTHLSTFLRIKHHGKA